MAATQAALARGEWQQSGGSSAATAALATARRRRLREVAFVDSSDGSGEGQAAAQGAASGRRGRDWRGMAREGRRIAGGGVPPRTLFSSR